MCLLGLSGLHDLTITLLQDDTIVCPPAGVYYVQRDLFPTSTLLDRLLYHFDMAVHVGPVEGHINSDTRCAVSWWRRTGSGRVDIGDGIISTDRVGGQLQYRELDGKLEKSKDAKAAAMPTSSFNLFLSERQREQKETVVLPHFKAQGDAVQQTSMDYDSDDPDADLEI
jgi:hypothetical protein